MLSFQVYAGDLVPDRVNLTGAYLFGSDDVPLRADLAYRDGVITCSKRAAGPAGLALIQPIEGAGTILAETVRLPEREQPYLLSLELARGRLLRLHQKLEDWGLIHCDGAEESYRQLEAARDCLIKALQDDSPAGSYRLGAEALALAVKASESFTRFHAENLLQRRRQAGAFGKKVLGCAIDAGNPVELARSRLAGTFDFVSVPFNWRTIEPNEQTFNWKPLDAWVEQLSKARIPMKGSSLLSLAERHVPDWLFIWEHDFDTFRDLAFEHVRRVLNRYGHHIQVWDVISGIHANNCFSFNFEQLMELTRMTTSLAKQIAPRCTTIIDITGPWGEYYARNQRTIPPLLYADMVNQSGISFDAFGIRFLFGPAVDGMFVRDLFQISSLLDLFGKIGKPIHVTAAQVPSDTSPAQTKESAEPRRLDGGTWREPWSEAVQARWLREFYEVALSKPFVESVCWHRLVDDDAQPVPHGGLIREDLQPKAAYEALARVRTDLLGQAAKGKSKVSR